MVECPKVSIIQNCNIDLGKLADKNTFLLAITSYSLLEIKEKDVLIKGDEQRKFIVFDRNVVLGDPMSSTELVYVK